MIKTCNVLTINDAIRNIVLVPNHARTFQYLKNNYSILTLMLMDLLLRV